MSTLFSELAAPVSEHRRFIDPTSGIRYYPIPSKAGDRLIAVPGVTSVLSVSNTAEDDARLERWRQRELAAGRDPNAKRERGTRVHAGLESWIRGVEPSFDDPLDTAAFDGMTAHLQNYQEFLWNERPLVNGWDHCWSAPPGDPDRLARVWSWLWGYAGTPDLIGRHRRGLVILGDFKTSSCPYVRWSGTAVPQWARTGWMKYRKTVRQLCAYKLAVEEMLDLQVDALQIIVGLPKAGQSQMFYIKGPELERETEAFKNLVHQFWARQQGHDLIAA